MVRQNIGNASKPDTRHLARASGAGAATTAPKGHLKCANPHPDGQTEDLNHMRAKAEQKAFSNATQTNADTLCTHAEHLPTRQQHFPRKSALTLATPLSLPQHTDTDLDRIQTHSSSTAEEDTASNSANTQRNDATHNTPVNTPDTPHAALTQLETYLAQITRCQHVGINDSTTGAHIAITASGNALYMIKSNEECYFELLGNLIAQMLELNIPGFALLGDDSGQQARLKAMLRSNNQHPCIVSKFHRAINLKDVTPGAAPLPQHDLYQELGRAFTLDLLIGNWDRFPVFENDRLGNFGNLMYEPDTARLLYIDTVARKHTETGNYGTADYLDLSPARCNRVCDAITGWLAPKFPALLTMHKTKQHGEFRRGILSALNLLSAQKPEIESLLAIARQLLKSGKKAIHARIPQLLQDIDNLVTQKIACQAKQPAVPLFSQQDLITTLMADIQFTLDEKQALRCRFAQGKGIPRFGKLCQAVRNNPSFLAAWKRHDNQKREAVTAAALTRASDQLRSPKKLLRTELEALSEDLRLAGLNGPLSENLSQLISDLSRLSLQQTQLAELSEVLRTVTAPSAHDGLTSATQTL